tara:strand:- start:269 stop:610 length:342 start_codon:yes stop_codon:yes gene_type:complete
MFGLRSALGGLKEGWKAGKGQGLGARLSSAVQGAEDKTMMGQIESINEKLDTLTENTNIDPQPVDPTKNIDEEGEAVEMTNNAISTDLSAVADPNQQSPGLPFQDTKDENQPQ